MKHTHTIPWFSGEPFERLVALLIALVTLLAAVVGYLQMNANLQNENALRDGQQFALQAMGSRARGEVLTGYAWSDAYRTWMELDTQAVLARNSGDELRNQQLLTVRDQVATFTPLLQSPYFDTTTQDAPNLRAYESDLYLKETTALTENFSNAYTVAAAWSSQSGTYVIQLTLLTVSLFLYALSTTMSGRVSWLFVSLGSLLALSTAGWIINTVRTPVTGLSQVAIQAYAEGVGLAHQRRYAEAVTHFDQALHYQPDYANALYNRANAHYALDQFEQAAADYQATLAAGRQDTNVFWNAGWNAYRMGNYADSLALTNRAIELQPDQVALHFNLALTQLASGDMNAAERSYQAGADLAHQQTMSVRQQGQQPPASLWWYLNTAVLDLIHLDECIQQQRCQGAPPLAAIPQADQVRSLAEHWQQRLRSLTVALEYPDQPGAAQVTAQVEKLTFTNGVYDRDGQLVAYTPLGQSAAPLRFGMVQEEQGTTVDTSLARANSAANRDVFVNFKYKDLKAGQFLVMKVFLNEREAAGLRLARPWTLNESGEAALPLTPGRTFTLAPGDYRVELYLDTQWVQSGAFQIR